MSGRIVITSAGAVTPIGHDRAAFLAALAARDGRDGRDARERAGEPTPAITGFDAGALPEARSLRRATPHVLFGVGAAADALRGAGDGRRGAAALEETGLVFASALGSANFSYRLWHDLLKSGPLGASPVLFSEGVPNALAGHVAHSLKLLGPGHMLGGGSDAGLRAIAIARDLLECDRARRVVVGAAEEISEIATRAYQRLGVAQRGLRAGQRRGVTRGRGLVPGEGGAALVLEREDPARSASSATPPLAALLAIESMQLERRDVAADAAALAGLVRRALAAAELAPEAIGWLGRAANGTHVDGLEAAMLAELARDGFEPATSRRVRDAVGDAFTVTPLLQAIEAMAALDAPDRADGGAAVVSISAFGAATVLVLGRAGVANVGPRSA